MIFDARTSFHGKDEPLITVSLKRPAAVSGSMYETDIALLLSRVFESNEIYLNPFRVDTNKELTDRLIFTDRVMLFIQAKDSPNTSEILERSIEKKLKTIRKHIVKATNQMRGALTYAQENKGVTIVSENSSIKIDLGKRAIIGIVMVAELFEDDFPASASPLKRV